MRKKQGCQIVKLPQRALLNEDLTSRQSFKRIEASAESERRNYFWRHNISPTDGPQMYATIYGQSKSVIVIKMIICAKSLRHTVSIQYSTAPYPIFYTKCPEERNSLLNYASAYANYTQSAGTPRKFTINTQTSPSTLSKTTISRERLRDNNQTKTTLQQTPPVD